MFGRGLKEKTIIRSGKKRWFFPMLSREINIFCCFFGYCAGSFILYVEAKIKRSGDSEKTYSTWQFYWSIESLNKICAWSWCNNRFRFRRVKK
jgi:hypothetical protein